MESLYCLCYRACYGENFEKVYGKQQKYTFHAYKRFKCLANNPI